MREEDDERCDVVLSPRLLECREGGTRECHARVLRGAVPGGVRHDAHGILVGDEVPDAVSREDEHVTGWIQLVGAHLWLGHDAYLRGGGIPKRPGHCESQAPLCRAPHAWRAARLASKLKRAHAASSSLDPRTLGRSFWLVVDRERPCREAAELVHRRLGAQRLCCMCGGFGIPPWCDGHDPLAPVSEHSPRVSNIGYVYHALGNEDARRCGAAHFHVEAGRGVDEPALRLSKRPSQRFLRVCQEALLGSKALWQGLHHEVCYALAIGTMAIEHCREDGALVLGEGVLENPAILVLRARSSL
mmetsp:Transcript_813/g.2284  ORF Transcript_813/g.2284 Transcript_813/m.2284 type:complete len:302 (-) Transcript_813:376-1281(-)